MTVLPLFAVLMAAGSDGRDRPAAGDPAPPFEAEATDGRRIALRDLLKKQTVVLAFYPKAFTPG